MPQWISSVLKALLVQKVPLLLSAMGTLLASGLILARTYIAPHLADPTGILALIAIAVLLLFLPLPFATYFWLRPKFKPDQSTGTQMDVKSGFHYCSACLSEKRHVLLAPTSRGWNCPSCHALYKDPAKLIPTPPPGANSYNTPR
jgi:hypothetical protein